MGGEIEGAAMGGGRGADGGCGLDEAGGGGGGGGAIEGLAEDGDCVDGGGGGGGASEGELVMGGIGGGSSGCPLAFLPIGGGGGGLPNPILLSPGFGAGLGGGFFRCASGLGTAGAESVEAIVGRKAFSLGMAGAAPGGRGGAAAWGGRGARGLLDSGSECEPCCSPAPVSTPPLVFFNLGIPPANSPLSCGADSADTTPAPAPLPASLLLLFLFADGAGGASPVGGRIPGIGGAPGIGAAPGSALVTTMGADLSFVWTDLNLAPLPMSDSSAPCRMLSA